MTLKQHFTGFSPNITLRDTIEAVLFLLLPWRWLKWRTGRSTIQAEALIKKYFDTDKALLLDSGRTALYFALKSLGVGKGDEVLVQAYTCVVVINAIKWTGAKPVFVDIGNDFCMDPEDLTRKISKNSKVVIIQHTFGKPADVERIIEIAKEGEIKTIEDCAHSLGARHKGKLLGTFSDIGMFSFGSDKVISCVRGGALIANDENIYNTLVKYREQLLKTPIITTLQHLMHFPVFIVGRATYRLGFGKLLFFVSKKLRIINKIIYKKEKVGEMVSFYPTLIPNCLSKILINQLREIDEVNNHRKKIAKIYDKQILNNDDVVLPKYNNESIYLRYTILSDNPSAIARRAKKKGIILGDWYNTVIAPKDSEISKTGYIIGSCPNAERLSNMSINLPTNRHITLEDAKYIANIC